MTFASAGAAYCSVDEVNARLYSGSGTGVQNLGAQGDPARNTLLAELVEEVSRRFDDETARRIGNYFPVYAQRYYSGRGSMMLETEECAMLTKVEQNTAPGRAPSWVDLTSDFAADKMALLPPNEWPKNKLWRVATFYVDPFREVGNIRLSGVFGCVQPSLNSLIPAVDGEGNIVQGNPTDPSTPTAYVDPSFIGVPLASVQPINPFTSARVGWWITPTNVLKAIAEWTVYTFKAGQAGYSDTAGNDGGGSLIYRKGIPPEVQMVIDSYKARRMHLAMIAMDGTDIAAESIWGESYSGGPDMVSRWAGWQTDPP